MGRVEMVLVMFIVFWGCGVSKGQGGPGDVFNMVHRKIEANEVSAKISAEKLQEDMDYLVQTIEEVHVNPYLNVSREEFYQRYGAIRSQITKPLTRKEFYVLVGPLLHLLRDSHTRVWSISEIKEDYDRHNGKYLPVDVEIKDNRLFVRHDYSKPGIEYGTEILSINGIESGRIIAEIVQYRNGFTNYSILTQAEGGCSTLLWEVFDFTGPFTVKVPDGDRVVAGMTENELNRARQPGTAKPKRQFYEKLDTGVGLLTVDSFALDEGQFGRMLEKAFEKIEADRISDLIIDVRENSGGNSLLAAQLIGYFRDKPFKAISRFEIKKSPRHEKLLRSFINEEQIGYVLGDKYAQTPVGGICVQEMNEFPVGEVQHRFKGKVYVLMSHNTYSSAVEFVAAVQDNKMGVLIGEETGDPASSFGECYPFDLPNSRLLMVSATKFTVRPNGDTTMTKGVIPDYEVKQKKANEIKGADTIMDFTRDLIKNKQRQG
ncbi:MAG: S41 family peptidase [Sedimentisphaerales bacterium]|jgi:C-terminal processing protease CtpA/Prc